MKKSFILLLTLFLNIKAPINYTYIIKSQFDYQDPVQLRGYYKGSIINLDDGIDFLPETELINSFELIITAEHPKISGGAVPHLTRILDVPCLWHTITWTKQGTKTIWNIEKLEDDQMPSRIPSDALIICYPPEFVEAIEDKTPQESSNIIHLPTIILKKSLSTQEKTRRDDILNRSILAHVDINACLEPARKLMRNGNRIKNARAV